MTFFLEINSSFPTTKDDLHFSSHLIHSGEQNRQRKQWPALDAVKRYDIIWFRRTLRTDVSDSSSLSWAFLWVIPRCLQQGFLEIYCTLVLLHHLVSFSSYTRVFVARQIKEAEFKVIFSYVAYFMLSNVNERTQKPVNLNLNTNCVNNGRLKFPAFFGSLKIN